MFVALQANVPTSPSAIGTGVVKKLRSFCPPVNVKWSLSLFDVCSLKGYEDNYNFSRLHLLIGV